MVTLGHRGRASLLSTGEVRLLGTWWILNLDSPLGLEAPSTGYQLFFNPSISAVLKKPQLHYGNKALRHNLLVISFLTHKKSPHLLLPRSLTQTIE